MADSTSKIICGSCKTTFIGWNYDGTVWLYHEHKCPETTHMGINLKLKAQEGKKGGTSKSPK